MRKMTKITKILMCGMMVMSLGACRGKKEKVPNAKRGTEYQFDVVDYIDIAVYGEDGSGFLEVRQKDISSVDFESEEDYIAVKKDLAEINPEIVPFKSNSYSTKIKADKTETITNGDIITLSFDYDKENLNSDMNIEKYEYLVENLQPLEEVDVFSENFVTFFATEDNKLHYKMNSGPQLEELRKNIVYEMKTDETEYVPGKTIMTINAKLNEDFQKEIDCYDIGIYLAKHNLKGEATKEKVLNEIIDPIEFSGLNSKSAEITLYDTLHETEGDNLIRICNLQKQSRQIASEPYAYSVVYCVQEEDKKVYYRSAIEMVYFNNEFVVMSVMGREVVNDAYARETFDGGEMILNFMDAEEKVEEKKEGE